MKFTIEFDLNENEIHQVQLNLVPNLLVMLEDTVKEVKESLQQPNAPMDLRRAVLPGEDYRVIYEAGLAPGGDVMIRAVISHDKFRNERLSKPNCKHRREGIELLVEQR